MDVRTYWVLPTRGRLVAAARQDGLEHGTYGVAVTDLDRDAYPEIVAANSDGLHIIYLNRPHSER